MTQSLAGFATSIHDLAIPNDVARWVKTGFVDSVGTMVAGSDEAVVGHLIATLGSSAPEADLLVGRGRASALNAAFINGTAAHALDYDDVALRGHPSTVLVPALLAEGEVLASSGADILAAYLVGYEVWGELVFRESGHHHIKGWHPTAVFGAIAAAAAVASLHRLDAARAGHAIAIGASQAGGLMANFGSMTKPFHAGRSASAGILAARLAKSGMTGSPDAIEHSQGFLRALSPAGELDLDRSADQLGERWRIAELGLSIKKYPVCYCAHRAVDGLLDLLQRNPVRPDMVQEIEVSIGKTHATILRNAAPQTGLEAKFSIQSALASVIVAGKLGLDQLQDDFVRRPDVQALMAQVKVIPLPDDDPGWPGAARADRVRLQLTDGSVLETPDIFRARGHVENPLTEEQIFAKFSDCLAFGRSTADPVRLFDLLWNLDSMSASDLFGALQQREAV
nr:MmgE/PrpD family protein [Paracoccus sp. S1E-3]